jgi:hypothetical protein
MWASNGVQKPPSAENVDLKKQNPVYEDKITPIQASADGVMWTPKALSRSSSIVSVPRSVASDRSLASDRSVVSDRSTGDNYLFRGRSNSPIRVESFGLKPEIQNVAREIYHERAASISSDHSHSTLAEEIPEIEEMDLKTPRVIPKAIDLPAVRHTPKAMDLSLIRHTPDLPTAGNHDHATAGPLEKQLLALLSKVSVIEHAQPTIMASDYEALQQRVKSLEAEKTVFLRRQEALWHCRDEDLANLIKIRGELAWLRRQHEGIMRLREEDTENLLTVRDKLAKLTWATERKQQDMGLQRTTSFSAIPIGRASARQSVSPGSDLWAVAKSAAMEQRVLELESANATLRADLDKARSNSTGSLSRPVSLSRMSTSEDAGFEGSHHHRARSVARLATLRTENETLRRDLARKEDENAELEEKLERLQRRSGIFAL